VDRCLDQDRRRPPWANLCSPDPNHARAWGSLLLGSRLREILTGTGTSAWTPRWPAWLTPPTRHDSLRRFWFPPNVSCAPAREALRTRTRSASKPLAAQSTPRCRGQATRLSRLAATLSPCSVTANVYDCRALAWPRVCPIRPSTIGTSLTNARVAIRLTYARNEPPNRGQVLRSAPTKTKRSRSTKL